MRYLLLSLLVVLPAVTAAQELHTFSNGEVADAEKINENFAEIKAALSALNTKRPRVAWVNSEGKVSGDWYVENNTEFIAIRIANDPVVYCSPFRPRDAYNDGGDVLYSLENCTGDGFARSGFSGGGEAYNTVLVTGNSEFLLRKVNGAPVTESFAHSVFRSESQICENVQTELGSNDNFVYLPVEPTELLVSDFQQVHTLQWVTD